MITVENEKIHMKGNADELFTDMIYLINAYIETTPYKEIKNDINDESYIKNIVSDLEQLAHSIRNY